MQWHAPTHLMYGVPTFPRIIMLIIMLIMNAYSSLTLPDLGSTSALMYGVYECILRVVPIFIWLPIFCFSVRPITSRLNLIIKLVSYNDVVSKVPEWQER